MPWYSPRSWFRRDEVVHGVDVAALRGRVLDGAGRLREDAWQNILTAIGTANDKRSHAFLKPHRVTSHQARLIWELDSLGARFVEKLPKDSMRRGFRFKCGDLKLSEKVHAQLEAHKLTRAFVRAKQYERAYGGAAIMPLANDGSADLSKPLRRDRVASVSGYVVFEARQLLPERWYLTADAGEKRNTPEVYRVVPLAIPGAQSYGVTEFIHESRLVRFMGIRASEEMCLLGEYGWGVSEMTRIESHLRDLNMDWASCHVILNHFSQGVYKMKGLARLLDDNKDDAVMKQIMMTDIVSSVLKSVVIDGDDDFQRQQTPVSGYADLLVQAQTWFSAICDMPVTVMFGVSPAGLNATGESDIALWDDRCEASQQQHNDQLEECVSFELLALDGPTRGREPPMWSIEYNPLRQQTPKEKAETEYINAQRDDLYIKNETVSREEIAASHWQGDTYCPDIVIDWAARKAQDMAADPVVQAEPDVPLDPTTGLPLAPPPANATPPEGVGAATAEQVLAEAKPAKKATDRVDFIELQVLASELEAFMVNAPRLARMEVDDNQRRYLQALHELLRAELAACGFSESGDEELLCAVNARISSGVTTYPALRNGVH